MDANGILVVHDSVVNGCNRTAVHVDPAAICWTTIIQRNHPFATAVESGVSAGLGAD